MEKKAYFWISAVLFTLIAAAHLCRSISGWPLQLGDWSLPMWISWGGLVVTACLAGWGFWLGSK